VLASPKGGNFPYPNAHVRNWRRKRERRQSEPGLCEKPSHGTTVMMLYVMVNCNVVDEKDAEVLINAE
jgi:hypothetical protein